MNKKMQASFFFIMIGTLFIGCTSSISDSGGGGTTSISFDLQSNAYVTLWIENEYKTTVATLLNHEQMEAGTQEVDFNASILPSGIYFYYIHAEFLPPASGTFTQVKRMLLLR